MGRPAILKVDIVADAKGVSSGVSEAESKFSRFGSKAKAVGKAAAVGLGAAAVAAAGVAKVTLDAASRTQQAYGALETIYGRNAKQVKAWAETAADSVGLAKSEYAELSSLVGSQLQNMGMAQDESAKRTDKLIRLGADLAATYGGSVADAVSAVSSLMKGEADPIERYGVGIKKADVNARLAAEGLDKLTGKALKQAEAQTLLTMLTEQTAKTQGAFGREANTLAGQTERLRAKFENLKSTIGEKLLPVATRAVGWVNKQIDGNGKLGAVIREKVIPAFRAVTGFITDKVIPAAQRLWSWYAEKIAPALRGALVPAMESARRAVDQVRAAFARNEPELRTTAELMRVNARAIALVTEHTARMIGLFAKITVPVGIRTTSLAISHLVDQISAAVRAVQNLVGWISRIDMPSLDLNPFGKGSAGALAVGSGPATGAAGDGWAAILGAGGGGGLYVDRRSFPVVVQVSTDGLTDEAALARRIEGVLRRNAQRLGQSTALIGA